MSNQTIMNENENNIDPSEKRYVRAVTRGRQPNYLSVSIPQAVAKKVGLTENSFVKIYVDKLNNLQFTKIDL
jgi:hypothetical protein